MFRLDRRLRDPDTSEDHCPGGCYLFYSEPEDNLGKLHVPVDMFWGRIPWRWACPQP